MKKVIVFLMLSFFYSVIVNAQNAYAITDKSEYISLMTEEKLAHDVYATFYEKYGKQIFGNILQSEKRHFKMMSELVNKKAGDTKNWELGEIGQFNDEKFQLMYDVMVARGQTNLTEAFKVGALIEETDIQDLRQIRSVEQDSEALALFDQLIQASTNHLKAFVNNLGKKGIQYEAVLLDKDDFKTLMDAPKSCCKNGDEIKCATSKKGCCSK